MRTKKKRKKCTKILNDLKVSLEEKKEREKEK